MATLSERIAESALATFDSLPTKSKPRVYPNGTREWIPMSAIILVEHAQTEAEELTCVSLATGTKCLPASCVPRCQGTVLHDSHAEVLALRGFNRFLLSQIESLLMMEEYDSRWVKFQHSSQDASQKLFVLQPQVSIYMFSSEAPCGDASMDLLIGSMRQEDAQAWPEPASESSSMHGRGYFSMLGAVRRKPARADAEPTLSKSCTDKLTLKQFTSVLSFPTSLFIEKTPNAFLKALILFPDRYDENAFERAFGPNGRLSQRVSHDAPRPPIIHYFEVDVLHPTSRRFPFEKIRSTEGTLSSKAGNVSAVWVRGCFEKAPLLSENLVNGVKQGSKQFGENDFKMSGVCRKRMWQEARHVMALLQSRKEDLNINGKMLSQIDDALQSNTYKMAKETWLDSERINAKVHAARFLGGWMQNGGDEDWNM